MKKVLFVCTLFFFESITSFAQPFSTNTQLVSIGLGGGRGATVIAGAWEIGVGEKVGIGRFGVGALGGLYLTGKTNLFGIGAQANYHFDIREPKWDLYAGLNFVAIIAGGGGSDLGIQFGGRYALQQNLSIFIQLGAGGFTTFFSGVSFSL